MTVAVFYKGVFQDFWLNDPAQAADWIPRMIASKGWNPKHVVVAKYAHSRSATDLLGFDDDGALLKQEMQDATNLEGEVSRVVVTVDAFDPEYLFTDGQLA